MKLNDFFSAPVILSEGGNIFKGDLATVRINLADVVPTVKWLEKYTGLPLVDNMLGTTGRKSSSGDLDLGVDMGSISKDELVNRLTKVAAAMKVDPKTVIKKSGISVHFRTPIAGDPKKGFVQSDFMFTDDLEWTKFAMSASGTSSYKGAHRHMVMASIAKAMGLKWSPTMGLQTRDTGKVLSKDPDHIAEILLGQGKTRKDLESVETLLSALKDDPERDEKLLDARETLARENIKLPESASDKKDPYSRYSKGDQKWIHQAMYYVRYMLSLKHKLGPDFEAAMSWMDNLNDARFKQEDIREIIPPNIKILINNHKQNLLNELDDLIEKVLDKESIGNPWQVKGYIEALRKWTGWPEINALEQKMKLADFLESAPSDQVKGTDVAKTVKPQPFAGSQEHPFQGMLVGDEAGAAENPTDKVTMDIPLFIRMMEYAREDAKTDMDLHSVTERAIALMKDHDYLCMDNYDELVGGVAEAKKKPKPTSPEKWAQAKAKARSKFEVYPSAYANAWAAKEYKRMGGGWRMG